MTLKKALGRFVFGRLKTSSAAVGGRVEARIKEALELTPNAEFADMSTLRDLKGADTGRLESYTADRLDKLGLLSIDILPGMRYFNIHIMPDYRYKLPRFNFEGMVSTRGSQLSADLYPDLDVVEDFAWVQREYAEVAKIYERTRTKGPITPEPSRLAHMRALCSPYFLLASKLPEDALADFETLALAYFEAWLKMYHRAEQLPAEIAEQQAKRRDVIARSIIDNDPDRDSVVSVYGEEMTCRIELAMML